MLWFSLVSLLGFSLACLFAGGCPIRSAEEGALMKMVDSGTMEDRVETSLFGGNQLQVSLIWAMFGVHVQVQVLWAIEASGSYTCPLKPRQEVRS